MKPNIPNIRYILPLILLATSASISSCVSTDTVNNTNPAPTTNNTNKTLSPTPLNSPVAAEPFSNQSSSTSNSKAISGKTIPVTLYTSDSQCQNFISKQTSVAADESINVTIGKILEAQNTADFTLSGYRFQVNNGVATIDLRTAPESKRQIASLSNCEQFVLFGSLRKTLTSNAQWNIKNVRFTEGGKEIVF